MDDRYATIPKLFIIGIDYTVIFACQAKLAPDDPGSESTNITKLLDVILPTQNLLEFPRLFIGVKFIPLMVGV